MERVTSFLEDQEEEECLKAKEWHLFQLGAEMDSTPGLFYKHLEPHFHISLQCKMLTLLPSVFKTGLQD